MLSVYVDSLGLSVGALGGEWAEKTPKKAQGGR